MSEFTSNVIVPQRSWRRWLIGGGLLAILGIVAVLFGHYRIKQREVAAMIADIRARGEPTTFAELDAYYVGNAQDDDTTQLLLAAGRTLHDAAGSVAGNKLPVVGDGDEPPLPGQPWHLRDAVNAYLTGLDEPLKQLHEAAARGAGAKFAIDYSPGPLEFELPHLMQLREAARALRLEAALRAYDGDPHGAADSLWAGLLLTHSLDTEPIFLSQLVRAAIFQTAAGELQSLLAAVEFSDEDLMQLAGGLQTIDFARSLKLAMIGERAVGLAVFENPRLLDSEISLLLCIYWVATDDEPHYLTIANRFAMLADQPFEQWVDQADEIGAAARSNNRLTHIISELLLPGLNILPRSLCQRELNRRLLIVAIALERYRRATGHPAPDLAALVPKYLADVPDDPSTGKPFEYRATDTSYVVYSPSQLFALPSGQSLDAETGANPLLLFRWQAAAEEREGVSDE